LSFKWVSQTTNQWRQVMANSCLMDGDLLRGSPKIVGEDIVALLISKDINGINMVLRNISLMRGNTIYYLRKFISSLI